MGYWAPLLSVLTIVALLASGSEAATCSSQVLSVKFQNCIDLPTLGAFLHYTHNPANKSISTAYIARPPRSTGWVAWGINPVGPLMEGTQAFVAYKKKGAVRVRTYDVVAPDPRQVVQRPLSFDTWDLKADFYGTSGQFVVYGSAKLPLASQVNMTFVWQVGPAVKSGVLTPHAFGPANMQAVGTIQLV